MVSFKLMIIMVHLTLQQRFHVEGKVDIGLVGSWNVTLSDGNKDIYTITKLGVVSVKSSDTVTYLQHSRDEKAFPSSEGWYIMLNVHRVGTWEYVRRNDDGNLDIRRFCTDDPLICSGTYKELRSYCCSAIGTGDRSCNTITCSSDDFKYVVCAIPENHNVADISVRKQSSQAICERRKTFGIDNGKIWVSNGCRGTFTYCYDDTQSEKSTPEKSTTTKSTPRKSSPTKSTPEKSTPTKITPKKSISTKSSPKNNTPTKSIPKKSTPTKSTPKMSTTTKNTAKKSTPENSTPEKSTPGKSTLEKSTPKMSTPEQSIAEINDTESDKQVPTTMIDLTSYYPIALQADFLRRMLQMDNRQIFKQKEHIIDIVDGIMTYPQTNLTSAERTQNSITSILQSLDMFMQKLGSLLCLEARVTFGTDIHCIENGMVLRRRNVALLVSVVDKVDIRLDVGLINEISSKSPFTNSSLMSIDLSKNAKREDLNITSEFRGSVFIPLSNYSILAPHVLLYASVYRSPVLFIDEEMLAHNREFGKHIVQSVILAVSIGESTMEELPQPIILTFRKIYRINETSKCFYWEFSEDGNAGRWSSDGCFFINETSDGIVTCECNHLTNFAILLDVSQKGINPLELQIITHIGCIVSLIGLLLTVIVHFSIRESREKMATKILICLCVTLMFLLVVFLAGIQRTKPRWLCQIIAVALQYFLLSAFTWMTIEAVNMYRYFVLVFNREDNDRFFIAACFTGWGIPVLIVICTSTVIPDNLTSPRFCFIRGLTFYIGVLCPAAIMLLANITILIVILKTLSQSTDIARKRSMLSQCKNALVLSILIGGTWILGLFAVNRATYFFQLLFCIFNSSQGFFVFIAQTALNKNVTNVVFARYRRRNVQKRERILPENVEQRPEDKTGNASIPLDGLKS